MTKSYRNLLYVALVATALVGSSFSTFISVANGQSPMDMMRMMGGEGGNMTDNNMMMGMMGGSSNMSMMPFRMGVLAMPMMCTTPSEILESVASMFGGAAGTDGNASKQMMMDMMKEQMTMMMPGGGGFDEMGNMTELELEQAMQLVICMPIMDGKMMEGMMGMGS
jgi:hypothetical protein